MSLQLTRATRDYLLPIDASRLGEAILYVDVHKTNPEEENEIKFHIEIYEERTDSAGVKHPVAPRSISAYNFVERRFKHGFQRSNRQGIYHPCYTVPATDYTCFLVMETWTGKRDVTPEALQHILRILLREKRAQNNAEVAAIFKSSLEDSNNHVLEKLELRLSPETRLIGLKPHLYQRVASTNAINSAEGYALFMEPGTGKTACAIMKIDSVIKRCQTEHNREARILILGPKNIRLNWMREIEHYSKWQDDAFIAILKGASAMERNYFAISALSVANTSAHILIAGYESAVNTPFLLKVEWDLVIIDESHSIANYSTKRAKFCLQLRDTARFRLLLTGTPIRNTPFDLYTQLEFLGKGVSGFDSFNKFKEFFGVWRNIPGKGIRILEELQNIPLLQERLAKYSYLLTKKEALPFLPDKTYDIMECSCTAEQAKVYKQIALYLQATLTNEASGRSDAMTINSHLTKLLRLAEVTSGYAKSDESGIYRFDPNPKLELLVEEVKQYLEDNPNSKVQIWSCFVENIKQIAYRFNTVEGIKSVVYYGQTKDEDRTRAEDDFNKDPSTRIFVGNPAAGGVGLNLLGFDPYHPNQYETNSDWTIYYAQNWSTITYRQSQDRSHRFGTRVPIRITHLVVPGSIDEMIKERVDQKIEMALSIQDVKNILAKCLDTVPQVNGD